MALRFCVASCILFSYAFAAPATQGFVTQPNWSVVAFDLLQNNKPNALAAGYYFLTPYFLNGQYWGPQIFDQDGTLIWYGNDTARNHALDAQICNYGGQQVICFNDGTPLGLGKSTGINRFFTNSFKEIGAGVFGAVNGLIGPDTHELNTPAATQGRTLIQDVYQTVRMDLSAYGGPSSGYVYSGCFQERSVPGGQVLFQWCSTDHVPLNETYVYMWQSPQGGQGANHDADGYSNQISGSGTAQSPWDYFHINAIDKNAEGDYLVSSRHASTIYKIAGPNSSSGRTPGSIIWYLGGKRNQFAKSFNFSSQHTVRFQSSSASNTILSLFNDASDGTRDTASVSSGQVINVDTSARKATLVKSFENPDGLLSISQGSVQLLANGNYLVGWGSQPQFTEFSNSGDVLLHVNYAGGANTNTGIQSYRAFKFEFQGFPTTLPDLVVYSQDCNSPTYVHASWNGATSHARWVFRGTSKPSARPWPAIAETQRNGFETAVRLPGNGRYRWMYAEALNAGGTVIGTSAIIETFVPGPAVAQQCGPTQCPYGFVYSGAKSITGSCSAS